MMAAGVLYFSFQRGIMTWYPSYLYEDIGTTFAFSGLATTLFFVGSLACRIFSPVLFNRFNILKMTVLMTILCAVCMIASVGVAPLSLALAIALAIAAGVLQGAFVAAYVFLICDMFPGKSASATSVVMIAINLGGITSPLWMGSMKDQLGGYTIPMYIVSFMLAGSVGLIALAHRMNRKKRAVSEPAAECSQPD
jgi:MFS family permease